MTDAEIDGDMVHSLSAAMSGLKAQSCSVCDDGAPCVQGRLLPMQAHEKQGCQMSLVCPEGLNHAVSESAGLQCVVCKYSAVLINKRIYLHHMLQ